MGVKLAFVSAAMMLVLCGVFYWYYNDTQERIAILNANNAKLETAVQISESSIATLQNDAIRNAELNVQLQQELQQAEKYGDELRATLQKHNLTALARKRPGLIENRMQDATDSLWDDLRGITDPNGVQQPETGTADSNSN
jgi:Tfp pilus assembly protein PilO